jgi:hypothetical protein
VRRTGGRTAAALAVALAAALLATGCGSAPPDLFEVQRSGEGPGAKLQMVVNDGGSVTCNGHTHTLNGDRLLRAREIARELSKQAELALELPPGANTVLSYRVRMGAGAVAFSDSSADLPRSFTDVQLFTRDVAKQVCGLSR